MSVSVHSDTSQALTVEFPAVAPDTIEGLRVPKSSFCTIEGVTRAMEHVAALSGTGLGPSAVKAERGWGLREGPSFQLIATPGVVGLKATDLARRERSTERQMQSARKRIRDYVAAAAGLSERVTEGGHVIYVTTPGTVGQVLDVVKRHAQPSGFRRIRVWSKRSQSRMLNAIASMDLEKMLSRGLLTMVTFTYPGPWLDVAPDAKTAKQHLRSFWKRWERQYGWRAPGVWKLEFQLRGAPHFHALLPLPEGVDLVTHRRWVAQTWNDVIRKDTYRRVRSDVGLTSEQRRSVLADLERHFDLARTERGKGDSIGTQVDLREGLAMTEPEKVAWYFLKHSTKSRSKGYQNVCTDQWLDGPGRFWGFTGGLQPESITVELTPREWVHVRRLLRRYVKSKQRQGVKLRAFQSSRPVGGWLMVADPAAFLYALAEWLASLDD